MTTKPSPSPFEQRYPTRKRVSRFSNYVNPTGSCTRISQTQVTRERSHPQRSLKRADADAQSGDDPEPEVNIELSESSSDSEVESARSTSRGRPPQFSGVPASTQAYGNGSQRKRVTALPSSAISDSPLPPSPRKTTSSAAVCGTGDGRFDVFDVLLRCQEQREVTQAVSAVAINWQKLYACPAGSSSAVSTAILNLMLQAAGYPKSFLEPGAVEGVHPQDVINEVFAAIEFQGVTLTSTFPLKRGDSDGHQLNRHYRFFWEQLIATFDLECLVDHLAFDMMAWLLSLTCHSLRNFRHVGVVTAFAFGNGVLKQLKTLRKHIQQFETQRQKTQQSNPGKHLPGMETYLDRRIEELRKLEKSLRIRVLDDLILAVPNVRWKDRCPDIRRETFLGLIHWAQLAPDDFLVNEARNSLFGWGLFDREDAIRVALTEFLKQVVGTPALRTRLLSTPWLKLFLDRVIELPQDRDLRVGVASLELLRNLLNVNAIPDAGVEKVIDALWRLPSAPDMEAKGISLVQRRLQLALSGAFGHFVDSAVFSKSLYFDRKERTSKNSKNSSLAEMGADSRDDRTEVALHLRAVLEFLLEFGEEHYKSTVDSFVTCLWIQVPRIFKVDVLIDFLTVGDSTPSTSLNTSLEPLGAQYHIPALILALSVVRHLRLGLDLAGTSRALPGLDPEDLRELLTQASTSVLKRVSHLVALFKADAKSFTVLAALLFAVAQQANQLSQRESVPEEAIHTIASAFLVCPVSQPLDLLAAAFATLQRTLESRDIAQHPTSSVATRPLSVDSALDVPCEDIEGMVHRQTRAAFLASAPFLIKPEQSSGLLELQKLLALAKSANVNVFWKTPEEFAAIIDVLLSVSCGGLSLPGVQPPPFSIPKTHYDPSDNTSVLALQCLLLAYYHLWTDLYSAESLPVAPQEKQVEETQKEISGSLDTLQNRSSASSPKPSQRKRQRRLSANSRAFWNWSDDNITFRKRACLMTSDKSYHCSVSMEVQKKEALNRLHEALQKTCVTLLQTDPTLHPRQAYCACCALLAVWHLANRCVVRSEIKSQKDSWFSGAEADTALSAVTRYFWTLYETLDTMLESDEPPINLSVRQTIPTALVCIDNALNGSPWSEMHSFEDTPVNVTHMKSPASVLRHIASIAHFIVKLAPVALFTSSLAAGLLSLFAFRRNDLSVSPKALLELALTEQDTRCQAGFWPLLRSTLCTVWNNTKIRGKLRTIVTAVSRAIPQDFVSRHTAEFLETMDSVVYQLNLTHVGQKRQFLQSVLPLLPRTGDSRTLCLQHLEEVLRAPSDSSRSTRRSTDTPGT